MNQFLCFDSNLSLDGLAENCNIADMRNVHSYCLFRTEPSRNMARFYALDISPDLFGGVVLTRNWGRIGTQGRELRQWFRSADDAMSECREWIRQKVDKGYSPCPSLYLPVD